MTEAKLPHAKPAGSGRHEERRRSGDRLRSHTLADCKVRDPRGKMSSFLGSTIDLSLGGVMVRTYEALDEGTRVVLNLRLPEGDVAASGTVVRVSVDPIGCRLAGVRFDPLVAESAKLLTAHLHAFRSRTPIVTRSAAATPVATVVPVTGRVESRGAPD
jgi:hypothetical protein